MNSLMTSILRVFSFFLIIVFTGCQTSKRATLNYSGSLKNSFSYKKNVSEISIASAGEIIVEEGEYHYFPTVELPNGLKYGLEKYPPQKMLLSSVESDEYQYFGPVTGGPYLVHFGLRKGGGNSVIWWEEANWKLPKEVKYKISWHLDPAKQITGLKVIFDGSSGGDAFFTIEHYDLGKSLDPISKDMQIVKMDHDNAFSVGNNEIKVLKVLGDKISFQINHVQSAEDSFSEDGYQTSVSDDAGLLSFLVDDFKQNKEYYEFFRSRDHKKFAENSLYDRQWYAKIDSFSRWLENDFAKQLGEAAAYRIYGN